MATNPYFSRYNPTEQNLLEDLTIESIKMYGHDMVYILRETVEEDELFGEDVENKFTDGREVEMYIETVDGFEGDGDFISKFGLDIRDSMTIVVSKRRWEETYGLTGWEEFYGATGQEEETTITGANRPREGDLIYFPLSKGLFEITFVEHENPFYQLGKNYSYKMNCELFRYSGEEIDTGIDYIDNEVDEHKDFAIDLVMVTGGANTLDYIVGEGLAQGTTTAKVLSWNSTSSTLRVTDLVGTITTGSDIVGQSSGASWLYDTVSGSTYTTTNIYQSGPPGESSDTGYNDNTNIEWELDDIVDFSENNPFGEDF
jgi:hypothetical protein